MENDLAAWITRGRVALAKCKRMETRAQQFGSTLNSLQPLTSFQVAARAVFTKLEATLSTVPVLSAGQLLALEDAVELAEAVVGDLHRVVEYRERFAVPQREHLH